MDQGGCGEAKAVQGTAMELFHLASLLMGDSMQAVSLVEETLAGLETDPCLEPEATRALAQRALVACALARLEQAEPGSFSRPPATALGGTRCVDDGDLGSAGPAPEQMRAWLAGEGREDMRSWLSALPGVQRFVFVQHAILAQGYDAIAGALLTTGPGWTSEAVGEIYRQALCSLANSLAHSPGASASALAVASA